MKTRGFTRSRRLLLNFVPEEELDQLNELTINQLQRLLNKLTRNKQWINASLRKYTTRLQYGTTHIETRLNNKSCDTKYHARELVKLRSVALRVKSHSQLVKQLDSATRNIDNMEAVTIDTRYVIHRSLEYNMRRVTQAVMALMDQTTFKRLMIIMRHK